MKKKKPTKYSRGPGSAWYKARWGKKAVAQREHDAKGLAGVDNGAIRVIDKPYNSSSGSGCVPQPTPRPASYFTLSINRVPGGFAAELMHDQDDKYESVRTVGDAVSLYTEIQRAARLFLSKQRGLLTAADAERISR